MRPALTALFFLSLLPACPSESGLDRDIRPPEVQITAPLTGDAVRQGDPITLIGLTEDSRDDAEELVAGWTVGGVAIDASIDAEGQVTGEAPSASLAIGPIEIVLTVRDTDDAEGQARVSIDLQGPLSPPTAMITAPEDGSDFDVGAAITFQGTGEDAWTAAEDLQFRWISDLDGELSGAVSAAGQSIVVADALSQGQHRITLEVIDGDGAIGTDTITVDVDVVINPQKPAQPGDLVFSEMLINPVAVDDHRGEWVELYNTSGHNIDIGGYSFHDDDDDFFVLGGPLLVAANSYVVLCASLNPNENGGVPCDGWFDRPTSAAGGLQLANNPDEVVLSRPDGTEIDWLYYDDSWIEAGIAIGVKPEFLDADANDLLENWCWQTTVIATSGEPGTPGQGNDPC